MQNVTGQVRGRMASTMQWVARRPWIATGVGVGAVVMVAGTSWALWPSSEPSASPPRARVYKDVDVCLLTDAQGIAGGPGRQAWQGLQDFSKKTAVRVSYVPVVGPPTTTNATAYLAGLMQRRCRVVVAAGSAQVDAAKAAAQRSPDTGFVLVVSKVPGQAGAPKDPANLVSVDAADHGLAGSVSTAVSRLVRL